MSSVFIVICSNTSRQSHNAYLVWVKDCLILGYGEVIFFPADFQDMRAAFNGCLCHCVRGDARRESICG